MRQWRMLWVVVLAGVGASASARDVLVIDFEQGSDVAKHERLELRGVDAAIVAGGPDGKGHCLRIHNPQPSTACALRLKGPIEVRKNLILSFWHRAEIEKGFEGAYLGMTFYVNGEQWFWASDKFSREWRLAQVQIGTLRDHGQKRKMRLGLVLSGIQLYGRVRETTKVRTATKARMTVSFDNIRLYTGHPKRALSERTRDSTANPPMLNWPKLDEEGGQRLQYSMDPAFPNDASVTVDVRHNFHMPSAPLKPGTWFWRVWSRSELSEGWSDVERVNVLPEAHRFTTKPIPVDELARRPRPRLLPLAGLDQPEAAAERKALLVKKARSIHKHGVQAHPGPHVKGDPRWPTWIDWYGKVAGRITGGTGRRLQTIAQYAMLTQDPQVIQWAKELALEACKWDPEGGSHMRRGDIGAHHLLRGLNWCYDACRDRMTPAERETLRNVIVVRANQFHHALNPFRGGEANNHAWLRAFGLAESGIVLLGDHERAGEWAEYVRQLYLGRFLCCLGYQGDNNEGVSYWGYGLMFVIDYADLMKAVCGIDLFAHPWLSQTARFPMYCAPPGAWAVSFGDNGMPNHGIRGPAQTRRVRDLARRTRDPYALWYGGERATVDGITPRPPVDIPQSIHYRHIGWALFNTSLIDGLEGVTVAMHSGRYYAGHQHPDQNSFVVNAYGEKLAIDGGYYDWYGSPHFKAYSMTTLAHNTLLVDGEGQAACRKGADGRIAAWFDSPGYGYTVGDAADPDIYGGKLKRCDRRILFIKPGFVVVHDLVAAAKAPVKLDWMLHAIVPIKANAAGKSFAIECERAALRGRFLAPAGVGMEVKTGFPVEPVNRYSTNPVPENKYFPEWHLYATPKQPVAEAEFLAAMQIQRLGATAHPVAAIEPLNAENAHGARLRCGDRTHLVLFRKGSSQGVMRGGGLECDGEAAAAELDAEGAVRRAFVAAARSLHYKGKALFESKEPRHWAMSYAGGPASGPIKGTWVRVNGTRSALEGYERQLPDEALRTWWGQVELPRADRYGIMLEGWTGEAAPRLRIDKRQVELAAGPKPRCTLWLREGPHVLSLAGNGTLEGVTLAGQGLKIAPAKMLPKSFQPSKGSILAEAEKPSAEGEVKGRVMGKVGASGGVAHCVWDTEGQWAEWQFAVPAAGDYELLVRGASAHDEILREITLDGEPLSPAVGVVRFAGTGGWCRTTNDWRHFRVADAKGTPARIHLAAGTHTLRMVQLGGSMNVDCFVWQPAADR